MEALGTSTKDMGLQGSNIAILAENRYLWAVTYLSTVNGLGKIVPLG